MAARGAGDRQRPRLGAGGGVWRGGRDRGHRGHGRGGAWAARRAGGKGGRLGAAPRRPWRRVRPRDAGAAAGADALRFEPNDHAAGGGNPALAGAEPAPGLGRLGDAGGQNERGPARAGDLPRGETRRTGDAGDGAGGGRRAGGVHARGGAAAGVSRSAGAADRRAVHASPGIRGAFQIPAERAAAGRDGERVRGERGAGRGVAGGKGFRFRVSGFWFGRSGRFSAGSGGTRGSGDGAGESAVGESRRADDGGIGGAFHDGGGRGGAGAGGVPGGVDRGGGRGERGAAGGRAAFLCGRGDERATGGAGCERDSADFRSAAGAGAGHHGGRRGGAASGDRGRGGSAGGGGARGAGAGRARGRCAVRDRRERAHSVRARRAGAGAGNGRADAAADVQSRAGAGGAAVGCGDRSAGRAGDHHRLHAAESGHRDEGRAEPALDLRDDPPRPGARQRDGGSAHFQR